MAHAGSLHASHTAGWASLWESGYEIEGRFYVARAVNTSMYSMLSAIRADFDFSLSPGGLTDGALVCAIWRCRLLGVAAAHSCSVSPCLCGCAGDQATTVIHSGVRDDGSGDWCATTM